MKSYNNLKWNKTVVIKKEKKAQFLLLDFNKVLTSLISYIVPLPQKKELY